MKTPLPLPQEKKLTVIYRVEPGCLGPQGKDKIEDFCRFVQKKIETLDADYIIWEISPRHDKNLPEMQYKAIGKKINHDQAEKYLAIFEKELDEFEGHLIDKLTDLINEYMGH